MRTIVFYLPDTVPWGVITPDAPMIGGREAATLRVAQGFAQRGWHTTILWPCEPRVDDTGVFWQDCRVIAPTQIPCDVFVAVEGYDVLRTIKARTRIVWRHNGNGTLTVPDRCITHYMLNSQTHVDVFTAENPQAQTTKFHIIGSGIDLADYDGPSSTVAGRLFYQSSHDRGLHHLLRWWPAIKKRFSHATLHVTYAPQTISPLRWAHSLEAEWVRTVEQSQNLPGVTFLGAIPREQLIREQRETQLFVYPCDTPGLGETFCLAVMEMAAARVPLLLAASNALPELYGDAAWFLPLPVNDALWIATITQLLTDPTRRRQYVERARQIAEQHTYDKVIERWNEILNPAYMRVGAR